MVTLPTGTNEGVGSAENVPVTEVDERLMIWLADTGLGLPYVSLATTVYGPPSNVVGKNLRRVREMERRDGSRPEVHRGRGRDGLELGPQRIALDEKQRGRIRGGRAAERLRSDRRSCLRKPG